MATIALSTYLASRPTATTPLGETDLVLIMQGGVVKQVASGDVGGSGGSVSSVLISSTLNPITTLPESGEIVYVKVDAEGVCNFAPFTGAHTMCIELQNGISGEGESIRVKLIGINWYKIS